MRLCPLPLWLKYVLTLGVFVPLTVAAVLYVRSESTASSAEPPAASLSSQQAERSVIRPCTTRPIRARVRPPSHSNARSSPTCTRVSPTMTSPAPPERSAAICFRASTPAGLRSAATRSPGASASRFEESSTCVCTRSLGARTTASRRPDPRGCRSVPHARADRHNGEPRPARPPFQDRTALAGLLSHPLRASPRRPAPQTAQHAPRGNSQRRAGSKPQPGVACIGQFEQRPLVLLALSATGGLEFRSVLSGRGRAGRWVAYLATSRFLAKAPVPLVCA